MPTDAALCALRDAGQSYRQIATSLNLSVGGVRGRVSRYRRKQKPTEFNTGGIQAEKNSVRDNVLPFAVLPRRPCPTTDIECWKDTLQSLTNRKQFIVVSHLCDIHFPNHDSAALNLAYRLIARKQPDIIVVGSDTADFSLISHFDKDPDADEQIDDELDELRRYWIPHIDTLNCLAPKAALVFIAGNHCQRIYDSVAESAPKLRKTIERAWIDLISYQHRVMWIGRTEEVEIGGLLVKHGSATNEHAAKTMLEAESYQVSVMAGHIHRLTAYHRAGRRYPVSAITSGALCKIPQPYEKRPPKRAHQWGTAFATVDLRGTFVAFDNVEFQRAGGQLIAVSGGDVLQQAAG